MSKMIFDTLWEQSGETNRTVAFYNALTNHVSKDEAMRSESWMDDLNEAFSGPEDEIQDDYSWMDDLDEAA
jgi:hypothetical protein